MKPRQLLFIFFLMLSLIPLRSGAQLQFTITPNAKTINPGQSVDWTVALKNLGSSDLYVNDASGTLIGPGLTVDVNPFFNNFILPNGIIGPGAVESFIGFTTA